MRTTDHLYDDLRYAIRAAARRPGFALVAVLNLAIGIGINTAVFTVVNAVLLRQPRYADPSRLVTVHERFPALGELTLGVSQAEYLDYRDRTRALCRDRGIRGGGLRPDGWAGASANPRGAIDAYAVRDAGRDAAARPDVLGGGGSIRFREGGRPELRALAASLWRQPVSTRRRHQAGRAVLYGHWCHARGLRFPVHDCERQRTSCCVGPDGLYAARARRTCRGASGAHHRPSEGRRVARSGAPGRSTRFDRVPARAPGDLQGQSAGTGGCRAARVGRPRPDAAGLTGDERRGVLRAPHCVRQRHESVACPCGDAATRDRDAKRARSEQRPADPAIAHGEPDALDGRSRAWMRPCGAHHRPRPQHMAMVRRWHGAASDGPAGSGIHGRAIGGGRGPVRSGAGHERESCSDRQQPAERRSSRWVAGAAAAPQHAGDPRGIERGRPPGWRRTADPQLRRSASGSSRLQRRRPPHREDDVQPSALPVGRATPRNTPADDDRACCAPWREGCRRKHAHPARRRSADRIPARGGGWGLGPMG